MFKSQTFTESEIALMVLVLKNAQVGKSSYEVIKREFNLPTADSARKRWERLNNKLKGLASGPDSPKPTKKPTTFTTTPEKRKQSSSDDGDDVKGGLWEDAPVTPRRMPVRNSRGERLKAEDYDAVVKFEDSGHEGTDSEADVDDFDDDCV